MKDGTRKETKSNIPKSSLTDFVSYVDESPPGQQAGGAFPSKRYPSSPIGINGSEG